MIEIQGLVETAALIEVFTPLIESQKDNLLCVIVGSFTGKSDCTLGQMLRDKGKIFGIASIDDQKYDNISMETKQWMNLYDGFAATFVRNIQLCSLVDNVHPICSDSIDAVKFFPAESVDFIFLDGCHGYGYVRDELTAWLPKMKRDGILAGHDWPVPDIKWAVCERFGQSLVNVTADDSAYFIRLDEYYKGLEE